MMKSLQVFSLVLGVVFGGCAMPSSNVRIWTNGNLEAIGTIMPRGKVLYHDIRIGDPNAPYDGKFVFSIRAENGNQLSSEEFTEVAIAKLVESAGAAPFPAFGDTWPNGSLCYSFNGYSFIFLNHRLVSFSATFVKLPGKTLAPEIGDRTATKFDSLPLPENRLTQIFGEAERIQNKSQW